MNWTPINQMLDSMKRIEIDGEVLLQELRGSIKSVELLYTHGSPETEIWKGTDGKSYGIPIELAHIVKQVFQFSADHGIDLVDALSTSNLQVAS